MSKHFMDAEKDFGDVLRERATGITEPEDPTKALRRKIFGHGYYSGRGMNLPKDAQRQGEQPGPEVSKSPEDKQDEEPNPV